MLFARRQTASSRIMGQASLRMVALDDHRPLTSQVRVGVVSLNKKGAVLILDSPFIDGSHVLMDVHNITPKLAELRPLGEETGAGALGEVVRFNRLEEGPVVRFLLEVAWVAGGGEARQALQRGLQRPDPEAAP